VPSSSLAEITNGWNGYQVFGRGNYTEVSMIQSNFGGTSDGHLEVVAHNPGMQGFDFYWRDDDLTTWHGPQFVS